VVGRTAWNAGTLAGIGGKDEDCQQGCWRPEKRQRSVIRKNVKKNDIQVCDPDLVDGKYSIKDLVDIDHLRMVFEKFSQLTGYTTGFLAYPSMEILIATGWRDVCTKFHRACPASSCHCKGSNVELFKNLRESRQLSIQRCENGMVDGATPIIIRGKCLAFLSTGQALFSEPDLERFKKQASIYGIDEKEYIEALKKVPVVSESHFRRTLDFLSEIAVILAERGLKNLELIESRTHYHNLVEGTPDLVTRVDVNGYFLFVNHAAQEIYGLSPESCIGRRVFDFIHPEDRKSTEAAFKDWLKGGMDVFTHENRMLGADGCVHYLAWSICPEYDEKGKVSGFASTAKDITERRWMEEALRASEFRYRELVNLAVDGILVGSHEGVITEANECMCMLAGKSRDELVGKHISTLFSPDVLNKAPLRFDLLQKGEVVVSERTIIRPDSSAVVVEMRTRMMPDGSYQSIYRDITGRNKAEDEIRRSRQFSDSVINSLPGIFYVIDSNGKLIRVNENFLKVSLYSMEEALSMQVLDFFSADEKEEVACRIKEAFEKGEASVEAGFLSKDGKKTAYYFTGYGARIDNTNLIVGLGIDITDRKKAEADRDKIEEQLRQSQKMQAIGQLAGGIAHDFNNQLMGIMGYAELLYNRLDDPTLRNDAESILRSARRASDLTRDLLAFSRKGKYLNVPVNINKIIEEVISLLEHSIDKRIEIRRVLNASPVMISGDPSQIQNALLNLAINAKDALPSGGEIMFTTEKVSMEDAFLSAEERRKAVRGDYMKICVIDDGIGMDDETKEHLFEPFFTTKQPGKGTGMGLASVYGTIKVHKGAIRVDSNLGEGTVFSLFFPLVGDKSEPAGSETVQARTIRKSKILLVDDDDEVRTLVSNFLSSFGHEVVTCRDGQEAVDLYRSSWKDIDLVILDMMMPRMNGRDAFFEMKALNKNVKALLISGFSIDGEAQGLLDAGMKGFIQKPFGRKILSQTLGNVL